jgi:hypothetical protein
VCLTNHKYFILLVLTWATIGAHYSAVQQVVNDWLTPLVGSERVTQHGTQAAADKKREYLRGEITWRATLNWLCWAGWHPTDAADYLEPTTGNVAELITMLDSDERHKCSLCETPRKCASMAMCELGEYGENEEYARAKLAEMFPGFTVEQIIAGLTKPTF